MKKYYFKKEPVPDFAVESPVILDLTGCMCPQDIHEILMKAFAFPDYYGHNWSALWDCLDDFCWCHDDEQYEMQIYGWDSLSEETKQYSQKMWEIFARAERRYPLARFVKKS